MKMFCYFCGLEFDREALKQCDHCRQLYCYSHSETMNHDCPLTPIQNPYDIDTQSSQDVLIEEEENLENNVLDKGVEDVEGIEGVEGGVSIDFDIETHKNIIENIIAEKAKNRESASHIKNDFSKEFGAGAIKEADNYNPDSKVKNAETKDNGAEVNDGTNSDDDGTNSDDDGTDIDMDIPGVYDIEAEFKEPDGFIRPTQIIKHDSSYATKVKAIENRKKECYFCGKDLSEQKDVKFIRVRNVEESFFKGLGRELKFKFFGSNKSNDGFYLCESPDCVTKWKMKEPVYIKYESGNIQKYVNEH